MAKPALFAKAITTALSVLFSDKTQWPSEDAKLCFKGMLRVDPTQRLTLPAIRHSKWLVEETPPKESPLV